MVGRDVDMANVRQQPARTILLPYGQLPCLSRHFPTHAHTTHETDHAEHNGNAVMAQLTLYVSATAVGVLTCTCFRPTADGIAQEADVEVNLWEACLKIATQLPISADCLSVCLSVCLQGFSAATLSPKQHTPHCSGPP